jgi:DNA-binding NarL/FixJ family response regulator
MPFVMVTSRGDKENVIQAIQAGVSGFRQQAVHQ